MKTKCQKCLRIGTAARTEYLCRNIPIAVYRLQVRIDSFLLAGIVRKGIFRSEDNKNPLAIITRTRAPPFYVERDFKFDYEKGIDDVATSSKELAKKSEGVGRCRNDVPSGFTYIPYRK